MPFFCVYLYYFVLKRMSKRNSGAALPEYRLLALIISLISVLISTVIFGKTVQALTDWSWTAVAVTVNFEYFRFIGIMVSSFVYCVDTYPRRIDSTLVLSCSLQASSGSVSALALSVHREG
jgi:Flp pilus assembly pilin Flp